MNSFNVSPETTSKMTKAAVHFLSVLSPTQRKQANLDFQLDERLVWHYTPIPRNGLPIGNMKRDQLDAAFALMQCGLSDEGLRKAKAIIDLETILGEIEKKDGGERFPRDPGLYFFTVFGTPGGSQPWSWRVEGHHLSLHFLVANLANIAYTPSFFGSNPAEVTMGPAKGLRILRAEEDLGTQLFLSLNPTQRKQATIYADAPSDIITRAGRKVDITVQEGLSAATMSSVQMEKLFDLIKVFINRKTGELAEKEIKKVEYEGINNIFFGWAGLPKRTQGHYYRLHGPSFFVEYDNTQNAANHIHSVWRDINSDFGYDILKAHYERHH